MALSTGLTQLQQARGEALGLGGERWAAAGEVGAGGRLGRAHTQLCVAVLSQPFLERFTGERDARVSPPVAAGQSNAATPRRPLRDGRYS